MTAEPLTFAIVGHLVGDYILQNDWMALNKKNRIWPCVVHCWLWTCSVSLFAGWATIWWVPLVLFFTHFAQDHTTIITQWMKFNGQEKFMGPPLGPWSIIAVDNVWHIVALAIITICIQRTV